VSNLLVWTCLCSKDSGVKINASAGILGWQPEIIAEQKKINSIVAIILFDILRLKTLRSDMQIHGLFYFHRI
jgi:hypothetical protein